MEGREPGGSEGGVGKERGERGRVKAQKDWVGYLLRIKDNNVIATQEVGPRRVRTPVAQGFQKAGYQLDCKN